MNKKETLLALLKVLERYTDVDHPLSRRQIIQYMQQDYQIEVDRKTFSRHINTLIHFNYDIEGPIYYENQYCYYLNHHLLTKYEAHLIVNTIYHSHYLSSQASDELINRILSTLSIYQERELKDVSAIYQSNQIVKNNSKQFFLNIESILDAIAQQKAISFQYLKYDIDKQLHPKREELYKVKPYAVICSNDNMYLIAGSNEHHSIVHFRIEKMIDVEAFSTNESFPHLNEAPYQYIRKKIKMFHGEEIGFVLKCDKRIIDYIIEECGRDVHIQPCDANSFFAYIKASKEGMIYFVLQYIRYIEVLEPSSFRSEIATILQEAYLKHK